MALLTISGLLSLWAVAAAEDWPHGRGLDRNGVVREESGWMESVWPGEMAWKKNVGTGGTSPLVVGDRLYTMGWNDGHDCVYCLAASTGQELWRHSYECPQYGRHATGDEGLYSGPSATPEYDIPTGYLYTLSLDGHLQCWNTRDAGKRIWGSNLYDNYGVGRRPRIGRSGLRDYGYTASPLAHGDWLLVEVGDDEGNLMAFDKKTGKRRWVSECKDRAGHTSGPAPITVEGVPCVAVLTLNHLVVTRLDRGNEGKTVAIHDWTTEFANNIAAPAVHENFVLITSGYNHNAISKLEITLRGARKVWEQPHASKVCTPVVYNGHVYWAWEKVRCLDFVSGKLKWEGGKFGDAGSCIISADSRLIVWGGNGKLALLETADRSPQQYRELAVKDRLATKDVWPHVVLAGGRLFCKDRLGTIQCFSVRP